RALRLARRHAVDSLQRFHRHRRERDGMNVEVCERAVLEGVRRVPGLLQVPLVERVRVEDDGAALCEVVDVYLQRRRIHRDEDARLVAGGENVVVRKVDLEPGDTGQRAGGSADLGGEVGERREVVPEHGRLAREAVARQLHPVAGVPGEPDHDPIEGLDGLRSSHLPGIADAAARWRRTPWPQGAATARDSLGSDGYDVRRLGALLTLARLVLDAGTLGQGLEALSGNAREVDEEILRALVRGDEAVPLAVVEPLHDSSCHVLNTSLHLLTNG